MTDYTTRNWATKELPFEAVKTMPTKDAPFLNDHICGMESHYAVKAEEQGVTAVFYYDLEQEIAGLDKTYGIESLKAAAEDFTLEDGTKIKEGALIFSVYRMNLEAKTLTVLFEVL